MDITTLTREAISDHIAQLLVEKAGQNNALLECQIQREIADPDSMAYDVAVLGISELTRKLTETSECISAMVLTMKIISAPAAAFEDGSDDL